MHPDPSDKTAREEICEQALRLFAERGTENVSLRQVAAAADVSPSLVVHHFRGKNGLRDAVNEQAMAVFERFMEDATFTASDGLVDVLDSFLPWRLVSRLPAGSPLPLHLGRLLMSDEPIGQHVFRLWHQVKLAWLDNTRAGNGPTHDIGDDRSLRAAWLTVNDLAVLLLRHQLRSVLGKDPLETSEARRWAEFRAAVYRDGLFSDH
jgi:AcrR family transcriptional regulator